MATPAQIAALSSCFRCQPDFEAAFLYLLAVNAGIMDPAAIAANSRCFACIPDFESAALYLMDAIASAPAPVSDAVTCGDVDPTVAPSSGCGLYYNRVSKALFAYNSTLAIWELKV